MRISLKTPPKNIFPHTPLYPFSPPLRPSSSTIRVELRNQSTRRRGFRWRSGDKLQSAEFSRYAELLPVKKRTTPAIGWEGQRTRLHRCRAVRNHFKNWQNNLTAVFIFINVHKSTRVGFGKIWVILWRGLNLFSNYRCVIYGRNLQKIPKTYIQNSSPPPLRRTTILYAGSMVFALAICVTFLLPQETKKLPQTPQTANEFKHNPTEHILYRHASLKWLSIEKTLNDELEFLNLWTLELMNSKTKRLSYLKWPGLIILLARIFF